MILAWIILLAIAVCGFWDFKKTLIIWIPFQLLFNAQIAVKYTSPAMSLVLAGDICLLIIYIIKYRNKKIGFNQEKYFFMAPMVVILVSYALSFIASDISSIAGINTTIKYIVTGFGTTYLFQKALYDKKDLKLFVYSCLIVSFLITSLGIVESLLRDNPILNWIYFNTPHNETTVGRMFYTPSALGGEIEIRYGMVRARSFFGIHITFGVSCLILLYLMLTQYVKGWNIINKTLLITGILLLFIGIFIANAKTGYIGLIFFLFSLFSVKQLFNVRIIAPIIIVLSTILIFFPEYINNFYSIFDKKLAIEGGGSTVEVRKKQFDIALRMFDMNPLFGNGPGSINILKKQGMEDILGAESSWMQILPERGMFGVITYIYLYAYSYRHFIKIIPRKVIFFFLFGLLVMETATGLLDMTLWGCVILAIRRLYQIERTSNRCLKQ